MLDREGLLECASWIPMMSALWRENNLSSMAALPGKGVTPASCAGVLPSYRDLQLYVTKAPLKVRIMGSGVESTWIKSASCCVEGCLDMGQST